MLTNRHIARSAALLALGAVVATGCGTIRSARGNAVATRRPAVVSARGAYQVGLASWYGAEYAGARTASGERFNPSALTAAHRTLPFGTRVQVTNLENGRQVIVRVNDRGPFKRGRIIDLSHGAAQRLASLDQGLVKVRLDVVEWPRG